MRYAMAIDTRKCIGCSDCVVACQTENKVPIGYCRVWVTEKVIGKWPESSVKMQSERCNHCENAPCVRVCPTAASHYEENEGIVVTTPGKCIGCGACIESCPYNARYVDPRGYVSKCTFCHHRVIDGFSTACTEVCPTKCIIFGDLDDPNSEISVKLSEREHYVLLEEAGTRPKHYFLV